MKLLRKTLCTAVAFALLLTGAQAGKAQQTQSIGYAVSAILPHNQVGEGAGYFDLLMTPKQEQVLQVKILNRDAEEIQVAVQANVAFTNRNGVIEFAQSETADAYSTVDFSELVTALKPQPAHGADTDTSPSSLALPTFADTDAAQDESTVVLTVPAWGETIAEFALKAPEEPFDGAVLGGLMFTKLDQAKANSGGGMAIENIYRYVIGIRLQMSLEAVSPNFALTEATLTQSGALSLHLRNLQPLVVHGIALEGTVVSEKGETALEFKRDSISMAPNTAMDYEILTDTLTTAQVQTARVRLILKYNGEIWQFDVPLSVQ